MPNTKIEIRCPNGPQRLFMKLIAPEPLPRVVEDLNLMELACGDCARQMRKDEYDIYRVLHRYAMNGELVESVLVWSDGEEEIIGGYREEP